MSLDWLQEPLFNLWHQAFQLISLTKSAILAALSCEFSFPHSQETKQNEQFPGAKNASSSVSTYWDISVFHIHSHPKRAPGRENIFSFTESSSFIATAAGGSITCLSIARHHGLCGEMKTSHQKADIYTRAGPWSRPSQASVVSWL